MTKLAVVPSLADLAAIADPNVALAPMAGTKAHAAGDFNKALVELEAAYALDPQPDLLYAIGQVESKLGNCPEATSYFERFRATQTDPAVPKVIEQAIAACKPRVVEAPPPRQAPPPPPPPTPVAHSHWYSDAIGDAFVVGGVAAGIVGVVFYRKATSDLDSAETSGSLSAYDSLVSDAHSERTTYVILMAGGGALVVAGIVKYVLRGGSSETATIGMVPASGGGLVTWGGRF